MGFPIARMAGRAAFIGAMIAGGLLAAGIAQAQAQTMDGQSGLAGPAPSAAAGAPTIADRQAELVAASGGPASVQHLIMAAPERPVMEQRADDVADAAPDPADALNAAEAAHGRAPEAVAAQQAAVGGP